MGTNQTQASFNATPVTLRQMTSADNALMVALENEVFAADPWNEAMVAEELTASARYYVAAETGNAVAGWGGVRLGEDADVMTIGVRAPFRRLGVGRMILADLVAHARRAGTRRLFLEVRASNVAAMALYRALGFQQTGTIRRYFHHPSEDAVVMRLLLRGSGPGPVGAEIEYDTLS